jgi:hypothetical protein
MFGESSFLCCGLRVLAFGVPGGQLLGMRFGAGTLSGRDGMQTSDAFAPVSFWASRPCCHLLCRLPHSCLSCPPPRPPSPLPHVSSCHGPRLLHLLLPPPIHSPITNHHDNTVPAQNTPPLPPQCPPSRSRGGGWGQGRKAHSTSHSGESKGRMDHTHHTHRPPPPLARGRGGRGRFGLGAQWMRDEVWLLREGGD